MTDNAAPMFSDDDFKQSEAAKSLSPAYFASRRMVDESVDSLEHKDFKLAFDNFFDELYREISGKFDDFLWDDANSTLHSKAWRMVDECVKGLLAGEPWFMERYALGTRYDCERVRAAVAAHIPAALQDARVADLEAQVAELKDRLKFYQER